MNGPIQDGQVIGGRYAVEHYHAQGGMQLVYKAHDSLTGRTVALKTPKNNSASKRFKRSAVVAARVNHPNVAKTLDYVEEGGLRFLIEEFIEGADLSKAILENTASLDPYTAARLFHHLAKGVAAAHHAGVVHRDLKPTNVMISGDYNLTSVKVTDFGVAKMAESELEEAAANGGETMLLSDTAVGALPYMAPEAIETPKNVTMKADIWSLGALAFQFVTGALPFGKGLAAVTKIVSGQTVDLPDFVLKNPQFKPLATQVLELSSLCMRRDPGARPSADELVVLCGNLCYNAAPREEGRVKRIEEHKKWGFIAGPEGDVFFHASCVYGSPLSPGDKVVYTKHLSGASAAPRAYPVIRSV
jgi:serine/threonine-protein kinase